ncbi:MULTISPECIES: flagellar basal body-associated FliL family protein [Novosphingobium]|uniref:flagellar basal body-associated FliL family protein n=1 Tax=Novosphingobium TaxID=165696 RepID=UPI0006CC5B35|nr:MULTISPECIES: flagellar basal body-associated FliL family protein [unclassified Novosphingobium]KPH62814.1 flagellar basal body protein FliL [Novosphingobium sp. ST904]MPS71219.1 flagellar basal body protein FliL [Novosphingobium sp.]WRT92783.1 flagellar basal body-associated FliL family protein [Novosphingobium sp. RL4]
MKVSSDDVIDVTPVDVPEPRKPGRKMLVIGGAAVLALLAGGGGAWWFMRGGDDGAEHEAAAEAPAGEGGASSYIEVPPMIVNLRGGDSQARFLKLRFIIVAAEGKADKVKEKLPVVLDALQPFLRELRPDDLNGSAAVFRIKEEMMTRSTQALGAGMVKDVLIQDLVQQ